VTPPSAAATAVVVGTPPSRRERRKAETRRRLVDAAAEVIAAAGVEATTISAITEAADVGLGTFYLYFADRDAVAAAVGEELLSRIGAVATEAAVATDTSDPLARHRAATRAICRIGEDQGRLLHALYRWHPVGSGSAIRALFIERMRANLEHAMKAGSLRKEDATLAAHAILGMYAECVLYWAGERGKDWAQLADFLERASISALSG
jgi:AcrR family transcriptional regulator